MPKDAQLEIYRDKKREWRWRIRARNGRILCDGGEGYQRRAGLLRGMSRVIEVLLAAGAQGAK